MKRPVARVVVVAIVTVVTLWEASAPKAQTPRKVLCAETMAVRREAPRQQGADPLGSGPWYINADATIWALKQPWKPAAGLKTAWIKPAGSTLRVTGHRLDGDATALEAAIPAGYSGGFQPSRLTFPTAGCWKVTANAGSSTLTFTTAVSAD